MNQKSGPMARTQERSRSHAQPATGRVYRTYEGRVRAWLGWVLIVVYIAFIVTTVVTIVYADTGWRLSGLL